MFKKILLLSMFPILIETHGTTLMNIEASDGQLQRVEDKLASYKLIYLPDPAGESDKIDIPFSSLVNPARGEFSLLNCGNLGRFISINTGYKQRYQEQNAQKLEIFIALRGLVEKDLEGPAAHLKPIWHKWSPSCPIGVFYSLGYSKNLNEYDYFMRESLNDMNLYTCWHQALSSLPSNPISIGMFLQAQLLRCRLEIYPFNEERE
jgi:hypothetical protein